jgi:hypothetical protein
MLYADATYREEAIQAAKDALALIDTLNSLDQTPKPKSLKIFYTKLQALRVQSLRCPQRSGNFYRFEHPKKIPPY